MGSKDGVLGIYDAWYEKNRPLIASGKWNLVNENILKSPQKDTFRGLNLLCYLSPETNRIIDTLLLPKLHKAVGKAGWFVPTEGRHITVLDVIPHNTKARGQDIEKVESGYRVAISSALREVATPVLVGFEGIFASPDGITLQGYAANGGLVQLREKIREQLVASGLANLEGKKYLMETAHVALAKFTRPLNGEKILDVVDGLRNTQCGQFQLRELVLNVSSRYDKVKTLRVVDRFYLGK